jgi:xyloglucan-specific endo-beta-1,4-glucanase
MKPSLSSTLALTLTLTRCTASAIQLCEQYGYFPTTMGFEFNNNMWGMSDDAAGTQCLYIDSTQPSGVAWHTDWDWGTTSASSSSSSSSSPLGVAGAEYADNVKAYPYSGVSIPEKKLVSDINGMPTSVAWDYSGTNVRADVSYDMFTSADPNHDPSSGDYEMMIW